MTGDVGRLEAVTVDPRRWLGLGIVLLAVFMDLVDITIVLIAAPSIQADLATTYAGIQWVVAARSGSPFASGGSSGGLALGTGCTLSTVIEKAGH